MYAPTDRTGEEVVQVHELAEAHTALGAYLYAVKRMAEAAPGFSDERLHELIDACIGQLDRADDAVRRLRHLLVDRQSGDRRGGGG